MTIKLTDLIFEEKADNIECQCGWSWKKSEGGKNHMFVINVVETIHQERLMNLQRRD